MLEDFKTFENFIYTLLKDSEETTKSFQGMGMGINLSRLLTQLVNKKVHGIPEDEKKELKIESVANVDEDGNVSFKISKYEDGKLVDEYNSDDENEELLDECYPYSPEYEEDYNKSFDACDYNKTFDTYDFSNCNDISDENEYVLENEENSDERISDDDIDEIFDDVVDEECNKECCKCNVSLDKLYETIEKLNDKLIAHCEKLNYLEEELKKLRTEKNKSDNDSNYYNLKMKDNFNRYDCKYKNCNSTLDDKINF